jgi:hypothetical protein
MRRSTLGFIGSVGLALCAASGDVACSSPGAGGFGSPAASSPAALDAFPASAPMTQAYGIVAWRFFAGLHQFVLTGYDGTGRALRGCQLASFKAVPSAPAHLRLLMLDGSGAVSRAAPGSAPSSTISARQWEMVGYAMGDVERALATTGPSGASVSLTTGAGLRVESVGADDVKILGSNLSTYGYPMSDTQYQMVSRDSTLMGSGIVATGYPVSDTQLQLTMRDSEQMSIETMNDNATCDSCANPNDGSDIDTNPQTGDVSNSNGAPANDTTDTTDTAGTGSSSGGDDTSGAGSSSGGQDGTQDAAQDNDQSATQDGNQDATQDNAAGQDGQDNAASQDGQDSQASQDGQSSQDQSSQDAASQDNQSSQDSQDGASQDGASQDNDRTHARSEKTFLARAYKWLAR